MISNSLLFFHFKNLNRNNGTRNFNFRGSINERKRFLLYCLIAFGIPIVLIAIIYAIEYAELISKEFIAEEFVYVYIPSTVLLVINLSLFSLMAYKIYRAGEEAADPSSTSSSLDRARFVANLNQINISITKFHQQISSLLSAVMHRWNNLDN